VPPRAALGGFVVDVGRLGRLLGTDPGGPGLALHTVDLLQFHFAGLVEVPYGRLPPLPANLHQVAGDRSLRAAQLVGDGHLRPGLQVQVGHLLTALDDGQLVASFDRH